MERKWHKYHIYTALLCLGGLGAAFGLGRLMSLKDQKVPIQVIKPEVYQGDIRVVEEVNEVSLKKGGGVVGVKTSKKYYFPWCHPIPRVKEENKVPFTSIEEAKAAGYVPAKNCKGLE